MESCCLRVTDMPLFLAGETDNLAVNNGCYPRKKIIYVRTL
jgi:hypothetical protein